MKIKKFIPIGVILTTALLIIIFGYYIYRQPYREAEKQNDYEENLIDQYLDENADELHPNAEKEREASDENVSYQFSDVESYNFRGYVDSVLVIDKINLKKAIIRGNEMEDNDYNLERYYFVTADLTTTLDGNYIIYGHSSQTYGHSFNRLDEMEIGDQFYILQKGKKYEYTVEAVDRVLRGESRPYFPDLEKRVTFVSCEKHRPKGYSEKRVIIVRAVQTKVTN